MSVRTIRLLLLWLLAGWQFSWAEPALDTTAPTAAPPDQAEILRQLESAPARGLLYEISKNGQTAYLFGTVHVGKADFFPLDLVTTRAMVQSSELVVELDATQVDKMQVALQRYAALPQPEALDAALPPALRTRFHAERNQRMSKEIDKMISAGRTPFVAVGALHFTGKDGLPALLEKQGYRVTNLYP